jgi:hypothetical protein
MGDSPRERRLIDRMSIHVSTDGIGDEISFKRLKEMLDGYDTLLNIVSDEKSYDPDDKRASRPKPSEGKTTHAIYLAPAAKGCYCAEALLYDESDEPQARLSFAGGGFEPALSLIESVSNGEAEALAAQIPSRCARDQAVKEVENILPRGNERISVAVGEDGSERTELKRADLIDFASMRLATGEYIDGSIIARVVGVDFEAEKIGLRPTNGKKKFWVDYDPDIEDRLVSNRLRPMTVNCRYRYDINGDIDDVKDASGIEELDLRVVVVSEFEAGGETIRLKEPLSIEVGLDEDASQVFIAECEPLGMVVFAEHQDEIRQEVLDDLAWRWSYIVNAPEETLAEDAVAARRNLLGLVGA